MGSGHDYIGSDDGDDDVDDDDDNISDCQMSTIT